MKCWGLNDAGQSTAPPLNKPTQITAGESHTCALDADGVKCWGYPYDPYDGGVVVPPLIGPKMVTAGNAHTCALDETGVKCWDAEGPIDVPMLTSPKAISAGGYHSCALDGEEVKCWGWNAYGQINVPRFIEIAQFLGFPRFDRDTSLLGRKQRAGLLRLPDKN